MTTPTDLHDLLTAEAGGPSGGGPGWEDVVRRGRHRQRVRQVQRGALAALAVGAVVGGIALSNGDPTLETTPPATGPTSPPDPTTTSSTVTDPGVEPPSVRGARAQGVFLTVIIPAADPTIGFDPCVELHPRVVESAEQIGIELVTEDVERGVQWALCSSTPFSGWAMLELTDPVGDRSLIDLPTGDEVEVVDGASLLFPTELPEGFTPGVWEEYSHEGSWTFTFWADGARFVNVTTGYTGFAPSCETEPVEVRGTQGQLCGGSGRFDLQWEEGGTVMHIEMGDADPEEDSGFTVEDVLAIAEGLERYDEAGPEALGT